MDNHVTLEKYDFRMLLVFKINIKSTRVSIMLPGFSQAGLFFYSVFFQIPKQLKQIASTREATNIDILW